jgi:hypothetical protein
MWLILAWILRWLQPILKMMHKTILRKSVNSWSDGCSIYIAFCGNYRIWGFGGGWDCIQCGAASEMMGKKISISQHFVMNKWGPPISSHQSQSEALRTKSYWSQNALQNPTISI